MKRSSVLFTELDRRLSLSNNNQNKRKYKEENKKCRKNRQREKQRDFDKVNNKNFPPFFIYLFIYTGFRPGGAKPWGEIKCHFFRKRFF